jgi:hypothetical protein
MVLPFAFIAFGLARRVRAWRVGLPEDRFGNWGTRLRSALVNSVFHGRIVRSNKLYAGIMHANIFGGFIILLLGTIIVAIEDDIAVPIFDTSFYHGWFYLGYKLVVNTGGVMLIVLGMALAGVFGDGGQRNAATLALGALIILVLAAAVLAAGLASLWRIYDASNDRPGQQGASAGEIAEAKTEG